MQADIKTSWGRHFLPEQIRMGLLVLLIGAQILLGGIIAAPSLRGFLGSGIEPKSALPAAVHQEALSIDSNQVENVIMGYIDGTTNRPDPLVVVGDAQANAYAKSSNVNGVVVNGQRYFYSLGPHLSYDPLSLGIVKRQDIRVILQIDDPDGFHVLIYQIGRDTSIHA